MYNTKTNLLLQKLKKCYDKIRKWEPFWCRKIAWFGCDFTMQFGCDFKVKNSHSVNRHLLQRYNHSDSVAEGTPVTQSLTWMYSCCSWWLSCGVAATGDSLWTCSKFNNQSLVAMTGSHIWTSSYWIWQDFIVLPHFMKRRTHSFPIHSSWEFEHAVASGSVAGNSCQTASERIAAIQLLVWTSLKNECKAVFHRTCNERHDVLGRILWGASLQVAAT